MIKIAPDFSYEAAAHRRGFRHVAGVDEVGRGPLAGPVVAAAVILNPDDIPDGLNDSKTLTAKRREALFDQIKARAAVCIAEATVAEIETVNILQASHLAMVRAVQGLAVRADYALIDGKQVPFGLTLPLEPLVKGDARSLSIAAASIVAKVWRDRLMVDLAQQHPHYGWERNAGYPTPEHKAGLKCHGVSPHHRRTFQPIHNILWQD
jgi:ribonuclease HII